MTPPTIKVDFASTALSAGYHVELAVGHYDPAALVPWSLRPKPTSPASVSITLSIEWFYAAAGVPTTEKTTDIIGGLTGAGVGHISFGPGSVDDVH